MKGTEQKKGRKMVKEDDHRVCGTENREDKSRERKSMVSQDRQRI